MRLPRLGNLVAPRLLVEHKQRMNIAEADKRIVEISWLPNSHGPQRQLAGYQRQQSQANRDGPKQQALPKWSAQARCSRSSRASQSTRIDDSPSHLPATILSQ